MEDINMDEIFGGAEGTGLAYHYVALIVMAGLIFILGALAFWAFPTGKIHGAIIIIMIILAAGIGGIGYYDYKKRSG